MSSAMTCRDATAQAETWFHERGRLQRVPDSGVELVARAFPAKGHSVIARRIFIDYLGKW